MQSLYHIISESLKMNLFLMTNKPEGDLFLYFAYAG